MSGLDVVVGRHVFEQAIVQASRTRLVIISDCTFKASYLSQATRVIAMDDGRVVFDGAYSACVARYPLARLETPRPPL